jgi:hypothetical protein
MYGNNISGSYFEFGCHKARTFRFALRESIIKNMNMDFYAFDSFQGLPDQKNNEKQNARYLKGSLNTKISDFEKLTESYKMYRKISIIKGFYKDTLTSKLKQKFKMKKKITSFINIDCDLQTSVSQSLNFALNFITNGTVLYIDDYYTIFNGDTTDKYALGLSLVLREVPFSHAAEPLAPVVAYLIAVLNDVPVFCIIL